MTNKSIRKTLTSFLHLLSRHGFGSKQWKKQFEHFGEGSIICWPARIGTGKGLSIGCHTTILENSRIQNFECEASGNSMISIGDRCYFGYYLTILNASTISIGNDVLIASNVLISSINHGMDPESDVPYMNQPLITNSILIDDGCWIGEKVSILPGVRIGKNCIIGANAVVTKDIPDYSIAAGNPAKVIKQYNFNTHHWDKV